MPDDKMLTLAMMKRGAISDVENKWIQRHIRQEFLARGHRMEFPPRRNDLFGKFLKAYNIADWRMFHESE